MRKVICFNRISMLAMAIAAGMLIMTGCSGENTDKGDNPVSAEQTTEKTDEGETVEDASETTEINTEEATQEVTTEEVTTEEETQAPDQASVKELYDKVVSAAGMTAMYELDGSDILDYYGIDVENSCSDYIFCQCENTPSADTVALFKCNDENAAASVAEGLNVVLESLKTSTLDYAPDEYAKAENAEVKTKGNFTYLIICSDIDAAEKALGI